MRGTQKPKKTGRGERHSAAWGKRLAIVLALTTGMAFGQGWNNLASNETRQVLLAVVSRAFGIRF